MTRITDTSRSETYFSGTLGQRQPHLRRSLLLGCVSVLAIVGVREAARAQDLTPIPDVSVNAPTALINDGSAAAGYRVDNIGTEGGSTGLGTFWSDLPIQDAPYTISVTPHELIQNLQVTNIGDALKYDPSVQYNPATGPSGAYDGNSFTIRGFRLLDTGITTDGLIGASGVNIQNATMQLEDKESISVLSGTNGFLYGVQSVGGHVDTTLKRPTATPFYEVEGGTNTGKNGYVHGDFGGPLNFQGIDPGIFGYRLNIVGQSGDTQIHNQQIGRTLESIALDAHMPDNLLLQFNASHAHYDEWGVTPNQSANYYLTNLDMHPTNPSQLYAAPFTKISTEDDTAGVKLTWKPIDIFTIRSEYHFDRARSDSRFSDSNVYVSSGSAYTNVIGYGPAYINYTQSGYAFLDTDFDIFDTRHKVTMGFNGYWTENNQSSNSLNFAFQGGPAACNFYQQSTCSYTYPTLTYSYNSGYVTGAAYQKNYMIGDEAKFFGDKLIILAGANYASTGGVGFNSNGTESGVHTDAAAITPTASATYKIYPWLSAYATFQQSLTGAGFVGPTYNNAPVTNVGAVIPPYLGTQWEGGFKATVGTNLLATVAIYDIHQPAEYFNNNGNGTFTEEVGGSQHDRGIEFKLTGKLWDDLTLVGGVNFMNPRLESVPGALYQQGQIPAGVSPVNASLYGEYAIPYFEEAPWLHGFILTAGARYMGPWKNDTASSPSSLATYDLTSNQGYLVGDVGFRYLTHLYDHPLTFRFTVTNVTNYGYWVGQYWEGNPRTYAASMDLKW